MALCGATSVAISEISVTEDNYDTVVTLLKEKFGISWDECSSDMLCDKWRGF